MRKKLAVLIAVITAAMMLFGCGGKDMSGSEYLGKWKATKGLINPSDASTVQGIIVTIPTLENLSICSRDARGLTAMAVLQLQQLFQIFRLMVHVSATGVGLVDGEFVINPTAGQKAVSNVCPDCCIYKRESYHDRGGANEVRSSR